MGVSNQYKIDHSNTLHQAFEQKVLYDKNEELLLKFINFLKNKTEISSQLYQDMFAEFIVNENHKKTFLEFGATDGLKLSNTYSLENHFSWKGVLAEPDPQWHNKLISNRPNTKIIFDCVWKKSNEKLKFLSSEIGEYSTIEKFKYSDKEVIEFYSRVVEAVPDSKIILYNFESNVRSSTILGIVGAGGIGFMLSDRIAGLFWDQVWTIIFLIIAMVYIVDYLSGLIRTRLI